MALRRDYSLTKDIDFYKSKDFYALSDQYESPLVPGRNVKAGFKYFVKIYEGVCGAGEEIEKIFSDLHSYAAMDITAADYIPSAETALLKDMYILIRDYEAEIADLNDQLGRKIDGWLATINPKTMTPEQRRQDIQFVGQVELVLNRRVFLHEMQEYLNAMMKGCLPEVTYPFESEDPDSSAGSIDLPVMTHIPQEEDIGKDELQDDPLMQLLYNITAKDSYVIMRMFHDYDNGNACVRLWKNQDGKYVPQFASVAKSQVYLSRIAYENQKAIWPGLIEAAAAQLGFDNDKQTLAEAILGPEYERYDKDQLFGPNKMPEVNASEEHNTLVQAYLKCAFNAYQAMLITNSLVIEDEPAYVKLMFGLKELLYAFTTCLGTTFDNVMNSVTVVKQLMADYRKSVEESGRLSEPTVKQRLSICETVDDVVYLLENDCEYHNDPRGYFEQFLAKQIAVVLLNSLKKETSPEAVAAKAADVMADKAFKRASAKLTIHNLKHASAKTAESVLAAMEGRK